MLRRARNCAVIVLCAGLAACGAQSAPSAGPGRPGIVLGVLLPLHGAQAALATQQLHGIQVAVELANRRPGASAAPLRMVVEDAGSREEAVAAVGRLRDAGAAVVIGAYSSALSIPAAHAASRLGLVYWEGGAVADQVTGQGLPRVFRVGASGATLGTGSATFAAEVLSPRLGRLPANTRVTVVHESDGYGDSVAGAAIAEAGRRGMPVVASIPYHAAAPDWPAVLEAVRRTSPDVLVLASYIPDGVAFRRAMLAENIHVGALIGSTMAECGPDFGRMLGMDAVGVFASDRPTAGFNPEVLDPTARQAYDALAAAQASRWGGLPGEETLSGFAAVWALTTYVLPVSSSARPDAIARAAMSADIPSGGLPNGGGLHFSAGAADLGQNTRAASVIWQWQGFRRSVTVWPPVFATGSVQMVPLPR